MAEENDIMVDAEPLKRYGKNMVKYIKGRLRSLVAGSMVDLQRDVRTNRFIAFDGGHHDNLLMRRSGHLSNSIKPRPVVENGDDFVGGIEMGKVYGKTLIGKRGHVTTVTPKSGRFLAIPLPAALGNHGVPRGRPRDAAVWGSTFFARSKNGNLILFGRQLYVKGARKGEAKTGVVPLFIMKTSVNIPVKIAVEDLLGFASAGVGKDLQKLRNDLGLK
jgi:hypothetical protein